MRLVLDLVTTTQTLLFFPFRMRFVPCIDRPLPKQNKNLKRSVKLSGCILRTKTKSNVRGSRARVGRYSVGVGAGV